MGIIKRNLIDADSPLKVVISNNKSADNTDCSEGGSSDQAQRESEYNQMIQEAERMVSKAKLDAEAIMEEAQQAAAELKSSSREQGFQAGYDQGLLDGKQRYEALIKDLETLRADAHQKYGNYLIDAEKDMIEIVMAVARKLIMDNVTDHREEVIKLVKQTILSCSQREDLRIRVAAQDYQYLVDNKDKLISGISGIGELKIIAEDNLEVGSCIVETLNGSVDSSINLRLSKIEEEFKRVLTAKAD